MEDDPHQPHDKLFQQILNYITAVGDLDRTAFLSKPELVNDPTIQNAAMTLAQQFRQEGHEEGRRVGQQEGRIEGERLILERQLTRKFGELDYPTLERIRQAPSSDLEVWGEHILDAATLAEVFEG